MRCYFLAFISVLFSTLLSAQSVVPIRGDTVRIYKVGGNAEVKIENATRSRTGAFLKNTGNGWGQWGYAVDSVAQVGDSVRFYRGVSGYIALKMSAGGGSSAWADITGKPSEFTPAAGSSYYIRNGYTPQAAKMYTTDSTRHSGPVRLDSTVTFIKPVRLPSFTVTPAGTANGDMWRDNTTSQFRGVRDGTIRDFLMTGDAATTFSNGLTNTAGTVKIGGALTENTTLSGDYSLKLTHSTGPSTTIINTPLPVEGGGGGMVGNGGTGSSFGLRLVGQVGSSTGTAVVVVGETASGGALPSTSHILTVRAGTDKMLVRQDGSMSLPILGTKFSLGRALTTAADGTFQSYSPVSQLGAVTTSNFRSSANIVSASFNTPTIQGMSIGQQSEGTWMQAFTSSSGTWGGGKDIFLNPIGGSVLIGATSLVGTEKFRVNGDVLATGIKATTSLNIPSFTPTSTADAAGATGDITRDENYFYIKTAAGWKRSALSTF